MRPALLALVGSCLLTLFVMSGIVASPAPIGCAAAWCAGPPASWRTGRVEARTPVDSPPVVPVPAGHEASSGVAVVGGGFIGVSAVWATPGLMDQPVYELLVPEPDRRDLHRRAAAGHTVMLVEIANLSARRVEGALAANLRLRVDGEARRPLGDGDFAKEFPGLVPSQQSERMVPWQTVRRAFAFTRAAAGARDVAVIVSALRVHQPTVIGQPASGSLLVFELRFRADRMTYPP